MFTLTRQWAGMTLPAGQLYIDSLNARYTFTDITVTAAHTFALVPALTIRAEIVFTTATQVFPLPWQGVDFLTPQTGSLAITITEPLAAGTHRLVLAAYVRTPALFGGLPFGAGAWGADALSPPQPVVNLQVQVLPLSWGVAAELPPGAYPVTQIYSR